MANDEKGKTYKSILWVNPVILAVFFGARFGISYLLVWKTDATFTIVWFTILVAVLILVNYFLYLHWRKSKT